MTAKLLLTLTVAQAHCANHLLGPTRCVIGPHRWTKDFSCAVYSELLQFGNVKECVFARPACRVFYCWRAGDGCMRIEMLRPEQMRAHEVGILAERTEAKLLCGIKGVS